MIGMRRGRLNNESGDSNGEDVNMQARSAAVGGGGADSPI